MRFASADEAMRALFDQVGPVDHPHWQFQYGLKAEPINPGDPDARTAYGAIANTMHFGLVRVDLSTGIVEFIDEDHRDGGNDLVRRVTLTDEWCAALRALDWPVRRVS